MLGLAIASPPGALIVLAGLGPLAGAVAAYAGAPPLGGALLEQLVVATIAGASIRQWRSRDPLRAALPALIVGLVAIASAAAVQPALLLRSSPDLTVLDHLRSLWGTGYIERAAAWAPLHAAAVTVEGVWLAVTAERMLRAHPKAAIAMLDMLTISLAAVAALNIERLMAAAARTGDVMAALPDLLVSVRVSRFYDLNAAGSVFLMALLMAIGLLVHRSRAKFAVVLVAVLLLGCGLWITGSRAALAAFALAAVAGLCLTFIETTRATGRWRVVAAVAIVVGMAITVAAMYPAARNMGMSGAVATRRILARTGVNMWRSAPVLGVGIGRFHAESSRFGAVALREELNFVVVNENAHNNFLQVLAEQGVIGLAALLALIGVIIGSAVRAERTGSTPVRRWLTVSIAGGLLTWLTGHPQLVPEAAFIFWILIGALAAMTVRPAPTRSALRAAVAAIAFALVVAAPVRAYLEIADLDLEHVGTGVSVWQADETSIRYREAGERFALYLPEDAAVALPVRRAPGAPDPLRLTFRARGRVLNEVLISGNDWMRVLVVLPPGRRRFEPVDFLVTSAAAMPAGVPLIHVGRMEVR